MYDEKLNSSTLTILKIAPIIYMFVGFWILSNHQMFSNDVFHNESSISVEKTGHVPFSQSEVD
jgi:hypothetical protein